MTWKRYAKSTTLTRKRRTAQLLCFRKSRNGVYTYCAAFKPDTKLKYIAHESVHLCSNIFEVHDIKPDVYNDEPQAYLTGWLFDQCTGS